MSRSSTTPETDRTASERESNVDVVIVGAGPAGCTLGYLLARSGVETLLIERAADLDRDFRGFLFQPLVLHLFDEMGIVDDVLRLDHVEERRGELAVYDRWYPITDLADLGQPYDYALLMEQPPLLELLVEKASAFENFTYRSETPAHDLVSEEGNVVGVRATDRKANEDFTIRSRVVVAADGRFSTIRNKAGIDPGTLESKLELLWFKLPPSDRDLPLPGRMSDDGILFYFPLGDEELQMGWFLEKGTYPELRANGIDSFREQVLEIDPGLSAALETHLTGFEECSLLHIEPGMSEEWVRDGLVLVGDAAHIASPFLGQGNSLAIQDAVVAHPIIAAALNQSSGNGGLPASALREFEAIRRPAVGEVLRVQRSAETLVSLFVRYDGAIARRLKRPLLRAVAELTSRFPIPNGKRELLTMGPGSIHVDTTRFSTESDGATGRTERTSAYRS